MEIIKESFNFKSKFRNRDCSLVFSDAGADLLKLSYLSKNRYL